jgi:glucokinase
MSEKLLVGVDVGGTNLRIGVVDRLHVVDEMRVQADFSGLCHNNPPEQALRAIVASLTDALGAIRQKHPAVTAVGLGFPGFIVSGRIAQSPNLPGLKDVDLASPLGQQLGLPVIIENDALAAAYGEYCLSGQQDGGLAYLGLGTGVGGGLISGGEPYPGEHGVAMEVGHIIVEPGGRPCGCGNRGCMEQYASASGIALTYLEATGRHLTAHQIAQRTAIGDADAISAYAMAGDKLAQALAHILKVADVGQVVIGGGVSAAWHLLQPRFEARLDADLLPILRDKVRVTPSRAGDRAGIIGAALLASRS